METSPSFEVLPPQRPAPPPKNWLGTIGAWIVGIGIAFAKYKFLLFGALKTGLSMLFMIWIYALAFGWWYAAALVFLIFVHEMGHVLAAKWLGIPVTAPVFIPFIGASILMKENPRDAWTEALMAYGGPLAGCIGSWICLFVAFQWHQEWLIAAASTSFVINLFNMIPIPPLDGGRICAAVSPWFWCLGLVLLGLAVLYFHAGVGIWIILVLVLISALPRMKETLFQPATESLRLYYATHPAARAAMALMYVGLIAVLLLGYWNASQDLQYLWNMSEQGALDNS